MALSERTAPRAAALPVRDEAIEPEPAVHGIIRAGVGLAVAAAVVQVCSQLVNHFVFDSEVWSLNVDSDDNAFAWASSAAQFAAAFCCALLALVGWWSTRALVTLMLVFALFSLDDMLQFHERISLSFVDDLVGVDVAYGRAAWPLLFFPLLGAAFLLLWRLAGRAVPAAGRLVRIALGLLVLAVLAEVGSTALHLGDGGYGTLGDTLQVAVEESLELAAWVLVTTALAATLFATLLDRGRRAA